MQYIGRCVECVSAQDGTAKAITNIVDQRIAVEQIRDGAGNIAAMVAVATENLIEGGIDRAGDGGDIGIAAMAAQNLVYRIIDIGKGIIDNVSIATGDLADCVVDSIANVSNDVSTATIST